MRQLLAVQAQDERNVPFALAARGGQLRDGLLVGWLMRSTLHLVDADDYPWLHALLAPRQVVANERRLRQLGVSDATALIEDALPNRRAALAEHLAAHGIPVDGQRIVHLLHRATLSGRVAQTPDRTFVPVTPRRIDRDAALEELARRYYAAHPGAGVDDLAYWSGLPKRDCRPGEAPLPADEPVPERLLPPFDELLLGWRDRSPTVPPEHAKEVHPGGGVLRAVIVADGVAVGTWTRRGGEAVELRRWTSGASMGS